MFCLFCSKETSNKKYCSISCANKVNNVRFPKKKANDKTCKQCGNSYRRRKSDYCSDICSPCPRVDWAIRTVGEMKSAVPSWRAGIREQARRLYLDLYKPSGCVICGWHYHCEVAHIIAITVFPDSWTIANVNDPRNLMYLCQNDHALLDSDETLDLFIDRATRADCVYAAVLARERFSHTRECLDYFLSASWTQEAVMNEIFGDGKIPFTNLGR